MSDLKLQIPPFSPRKVFQSLGKPFPVKTAGVDALNTLALACSLRGDSAGIFLSDGSLSVDQTHVNFSGGLKNFTAPEIAFDLILDRLDVDSYLPPREGKERKQEPGATGKENANTPPPQTKPGDDIFRSLTLNGHVLVKALKIKGANIQDVRLKIAGKNGLFHLQPFGMKLYGGELTGTGMLNAGQNPLRMQVQWKADGIRVGPMIRDILKKDLMEGFLSTDVRIDAAGDSSDDIRKSLHGGGTLRFTDGVIHGIDLPAMLQDIGSTPGLSSKSDGKVSTIYSEFTVPFTVTNGILRTTETTLVSPLVRVRVKGQADLTDETLDFRIEPRFMTSLEDRGEEKKQKGIAIPVLVGGTFSSPRFIPDLDAILKQNFGKELKGLSELQKGLLESGKKDGKDSPMDKIRDFLDKLR